MSDKQTSFFDVDNVCQTEWKDMPEFVQMDRNSIKFIKVHFETIEDMKKFSELIGKNITMETKGIYFPVEDKKTRKVYVDES